MYWIKVNKEEKIPELPDSFLTIDEYGCVNIGFTSFDYYDSEHWCQMPKMPLKDPVITHDDWIKHVSND